MTAFQNPYRARHVGQHGPDTVEGVREMIALGATLINDSSDAGVLRAGFAAVASEVRR